jgi:CO/xanthine dehydrogenase FAD-binding subunit
LHEKIIARRSEVIPTAIRDYIRPATVEEAWTVLAERGKAVRAVGGGIDVHLFRVQEASALVDLTSLDLSYVRAGDGLVIGATTTFTEILQSAAGAEYLDGILVEVLEQVASPLQRNQGTIGGTIGSAHPWSDVIPLLLVLDAELTVFDGQERRISIAEYLDARSGGARPVIVEVRLPAAPDGARCAFEAFTTTGFDVAILNCAAYAVVNGGSCTSARVAVGGTPALAKRLPRTEEALAGAALEEATIERAAGLAAEAIDARDDRRASADYRRTLARVGVTRCLGRIAGQGGAG